MTCYHPMIRIENLGKWETASDGHKYHPAKIYKADDKGKMLEEIANWGTYAEQAIPCGKCIGCRLDYSRDWANRGYLEAKKTKHNYFVTLTYDDNNINIVDYLEDKNGITWENENGCNGILIPEHTTLFTRNIKQYMARKYDNKEIKYMLAGEYGGKNGRPHYHLIFFNLQLPTESFYNARIINKEIYYQNEIIERFWKYGFSNVSVASWNTIAYVARYITKKINGEGSEELYARNGMIKEFLRCSKGIGKDYYLENREKIYANDEIIIKNKKGTHKVKPPKYFDKLYKKDNEKAYKKIQRKRKSKANNLAKVTDTHSDKTRLERLADQETYKEDSMRALRRQIEY